MANLGSISPLFIVADVKASAAFYADRMGFKVQHISPHDDPFFAIVGRDEVSIMLKAIAADIKPIPNHARHPWARWDAYIFTGEPDELYEEYTSRGITFSRRLMDDEDGLRGFEIADADGYVLFFGRPVSQ